DDQREDERDDVGGPQRQSPAGEDRGEPVVQGRLGDRTQRQRAERDAQLRTRQQEGEFGGVAQGRPGGPAGGGGVLQAVASRGYEGELDGHEERGRGDEQDGRGQDHPGIAHESGLGLGGEQGRGGGHR